MIRGYGRLKRQPRLLVAICAAAFLLIATASQASHLFSDTAGHTTVEQTVGDNNGTDDGYDTLATKVGQNRVVRDGASEGDTSFPNAQGGRDARRQSISYFAQLTDFQLADEESPGRVEFLDRSPAGAQCRMAAAGGTAARS